MRLTDDLARQESPGARYRERQAGQPQAFSDAAILFGLALHQTMGFVESLLELAGLDWGVADDSSVCRRQKVQPVTISARPSTASLRQLVDSTGIKMAGEGEWKMQKHGAKYREFAPVSPDTKPPLA